MSITLMFIASKIKRLYKSYPIKMLILAGMLAATCIVIPIIEFTSFFRKTKKNITDQWRSLGGM